jgi:hypothetical protein
MVITDEEEVAGSHIIDLSSTCSKMKKINDISQSAYSVPDDDDDEWIDNSLSLGI